MSKIAIALSLVSVVAVGGTVVLVAGLNDRVRELEGMVDEQAAALADAAKATPAAGSRAAAPPRIDPRVDDLTARIAGLESRLSAPRTVVANAAEGEARAMAAVASLQGTELEQAVAAVIDAREQAERRERIEKMAEGRVRMLLRDLDIDDQRRGQIEALARAHLIRRDERRDDLGDGDRDARRSLEEELQTEFRNSLAAVLTTTEMEAIADRLDFRRRGDAPVPGADDPARRARRRPGFRGNQ